MYSEQPWKIKSSLPLNQKVPLFIVYYDKHNSKFAYLSLKDSNSPRSGLLKCTEHLLSVCYPLGLPYQLCEFQASESHCKHEGYPTWCALTSFVSEPGALRFLPASMKLWQVNITCKQERLLEPLLFLITNSF
jgi:hypothetical protein